MQSSSRILRLASVASRQARTPFLLHSRTYADYPSTSSPTGDKSRSTDPTDKEKKGGSDTMEEAMQSEEHPTGNPGDSPSVTGAGTGKPGQAANPEGEEVDNKSGGTKKPQ